MDDLICEIRSLLELGYEGGYWDFKSDYPDKNKKEDKLHDIICMANNLEDTHLILTPYDLFDVIGEFDEFGENTDYISI